MIFCFWIKKNVLWKTFFPYYNGDCASVLKTNRIFLRGRQIFMKEKINQYLKEVKAMWAEKSENKNNENHVWIASIDTAD